MREIFVALRAALYGGAFVGFWLWLQWESRRFDDMLGGLWPESVRWAGAPLMLIGGALAVLCVAVFVRLGHGTAAPFDPPREFVVRGPYRYVRNPMFDGAFLFLVGFAFWFRSPAMMLFIVVPMIGASLFVVLYEEPGLERRFGESYLAYKRSVPRWLPRWPVDGRKTQGAV